MGSIYYCFFCDAEFNTSKGGNAHLNVRFFIFFSVKLFSLLNYFSTFSTFFKLKFIFLYKLYSHIFISIACLAIFDVICLNLFKLCCFHIFSSELCRLGIFWYDMFELVQYMFIYDRICLKICLNQLISTVLQK